MHAREREREREKRKRKKNLGEPRKLLRFEPLSSLITRSTLLNPCIN